MKSCHLQFLRYASTAPILNEMTALGAAHACRQLSQWASDPTLVDSVAAPVVTEAVKLFSGILEKAESQQADRFSECTLRDMRLSLSALRNFLVDEAPNDTTTSSDMSDLGSSVKERCRDTHKDQDHRAASLKASLHMWIMVFVLFTVIVGGTAAMFVMGSSELQAYVEQRRHDRAFTLLGIAIDALDALYPFLQQAGVDVQVSGVTVAAAVLEEMSSAQGRAALQQSIFFSPKNSLFEYRAGKQNFAQQNRVTAMRTRRTYALLCRQNITNPIGPTSRYGPSASVVFPAVSPGLCGNDAGRRGVFGGIMPPYQTYTPHVTTYRRNSARVSNYYHKGFGTSIAATQDYEHLSQLMSPEEVSFQFSTVWGHGRYAWCSGAFRWIALVVGCSLCLVVGTMDLLPFFHDKLGRACISLGIALIVTVTLVAVEVTINHSITHAAYNVQLNGARITGRCLAGAVTSATMNQYGAAESFLDLVGSQSLKSRVFFVDNNPVDGIAVRPQDMMSAAEAIGWKTFNVERLVGSVAIIGGYCFASFFDITREKFAVYIEPEDYQRHISGGVWVSVSAGAASFVFVFAYIRISPLNRLAAAGKGSPLLQVYVDPQYLRFVLYIVILVVVVATMVAINVFGVTLINSATTFQSAQTLQLIGATNRALSVVDNCIGSCGLPSTMTTQVFKLVNGAVNLVYSYVPYPVPVGDWESHYYGAQLALSKLPTVLEGMLSFSTPLVNRTSGYIDPRYLQHRMLASVDVNDTSGFVMERLPSSTLSPTYAFVSHSIGMSLALGGVCISVCVLGWLYFRMGRLQRARRSLRGNYVLMVVVVLLVSSMVLVNAAIMKYEMYRALEDFAKQELSLAVRAGNSRLEKISITSISEVGVQEDTVEKLVIAANNMSDTVQAGLTFLGRWRILEETSLSSNVNVVNVLGGGLNGVQATLPSLDIGVNPVCTLDLSSKLSVTSDTPKLACYSQLVNGNGTANVHRLYVLVWRDVDDLYSSAAGNAWQQLMLMSGLAFVLILMITMVWLWWVMHSVHSSRYYLFTHQSGDSETPTIRRQSVSRLNRIRWIGLTSVLLLTDISYVVLSLSKLSSDLQVAERVSVPYLLQDDQSKLMEYEAVSEGYNYLMYPSEPMTTDLIKQTAEDVKADRARYVVVLPDERAALELELQTMVSELLSASDVASYVEEPLVSAGYDSTTSWVANEYQYYVEGQKKIQQLMGSLASTFSLFLSVDNSALHTQQVPLLLHAWTQVLSLFSQLFILDHLAVASYLDLSRTLSANSNWRFGSIETANAMTVQVMEARDYLVDRIEIELAQFYDFVGTIMENSEMINIMKSTVTDIHLNYPAACAVNNPSATIWQAQAMRCQEDVFSGNATAYAIVRKQRSVKVKKLGRMDRAFSLIFSADLSYRKGVQLREAIDSGADVSRMQALLAWERQAQVSNARYKMVVGSFCAVPLMVVVGMCMAIIYGFLRSSTKMNQTDTEVTPLHPPTEATTRSNDSSKFIIRTTDRPVVRPLFLCVLITAIPLSCGFWLGHELVNSSQDAVDSSEVAALYGIQRQKTLVRGVGRFWKLSGQGSVSSNLELYKEAAASLEMDMTAFITVYSSLLHITGTNATSTFRALVSNMKNVMDSINTESSYLASATDLVHMVSVAEPLSVYARQVIAGMSPADNYALLTPLGSANPGPVYDLMEDLFNKVVTDISSPTADTSAIFAKYMNEILVVDVVAQAYLNMWHVAVTAAAKGGESIAATYWDFESLVGTDALTPLSSSGVASAGAAVTAITTFFAPLLAVSTTKDAVETLFTTTDAPTNETGPVSAYLNAAYVSTYLGSINTSATFANVYAYNRGLTPTTFTLSGQTPLVSYLDSVVSQSAHLMTVGLSTADYVYTMQPATMNRWIWSVEVIGEYHPALPSEEFNYRFVAIEWCSVTAAWVVLLYVVYFVFFVLSDP